MALLDLDELPEMNRRLSWFGWNRFRPLSFYDADHFRWLAEKSKADSAPDDRTGDSAVDNFHRAAAADPDDASVSETRPGLTRRRVEAYLREAGVSYVPARIMLLTNLRVLGYVFNPVSFFYCYDDEGRLRHILAEVNNTYLEQKPFLVPVDSQARDTEERVLKNFYVSPFIAHDTDFYFRFREPGELVNIRIDSLRSRHRVLKAILHGRRRTLSNGALIKMFFLYPLVSLKIIGAIHWQALKLFVNKVYVHDKAETDKKIERLKKEREAVHIG